MARYYRAQTECEKNLIDIIDKLSYGRQRWQIWQDLITVMACSINVAVDRTPGRFNARKKELDDALERLGGIELPGKAFDTVVDALEENPDQDFLGNMYMALELGNHWTGQFFTPYSVSRMMAKISLGNIKAAVEKQGWISVCDPCIGGGAMLVAAANEAKEQGVNFQQNILFVGQDIDPIVGMMAYVQISLLGCPGYIVVANTLSNPIIGDPLIPLAKPGQEFWYTPLYFSDIWNGRRQARILQSLLDAAGPPVAQKKEENFWFFFDRKEAVYERFVNQGNSEAER